MRVDLAANAHILRDTRRPPNDAASELRSSGIKGAHRMDGPKRSCGQRPDGGAHHGRPGDARIPHHQGGIPGRRDRRGDGGGGGREGGGGDGVGDSGSGEGGFVAEIDDRQVTQGGGFG